MIKLKKKSQLYKSLQIEKIVIKRTVIKYEEEKKLKGCFENLQFGRKNQRGKRKKKKVTDAKLNIHTP